MASREQRPFFNSDLNRQRELTTEDVTNQSRFLLNQFIYDRMQTDGLEDVPAMDQLQEPGTPTGPPMEHIREISRALKCIGDDLDKDQQLQSLIDKVKPEEERSVLLRVAKSFFDDGVFTWGRVVALFYFAYKVCVKALNRIPLIRGIINLIIDFMRDNVVQWIKDRGGWESVREYFGTTNRQVGMFMATGAAICVGLYIYKKWI